MAPFPALQEALGQKGKEGTQDPKETKVHKTDFIQCVQVE